MDGDGVGEPAGVAGGGMMWRGVIGRSNGSERAPRGIFQFKCVPLSSLSIIGSLIPLLFCQPDMSYKFISQA